MYFPRTLSNRFAAWSAIGALTVFVLAGCAGQDVAPLQPTAQRSQIKAAAPAVPVVQAPSEGPILSPYQLIPGLAGGANAVDGHLAAGVQNGCFEAGTADVN